MADTGGLVARGEGTAALKPKETFCDGLLNPLKLDVFGVTGGGLVADGVVGTGGAPLLNSAQRGHFRLVSAAGLEFKKCDASRNTYSYAPFVRSVRSAAVTSSGECAARRKKEGRITVVSGFSGRLSCIGVPPSFMILAFLRCKRRSWFFFILAMRSSNLVQRTGGVRSGITPRDKNKAYRFLYRLSVSASPVGARLSASVASSSIASRART